MTNPDTPKRVSFDIGCYKSLKKLPDKVTTRFMDMMTRYMAAPSSKGLNLETILSAKDKNIKSLRVDQAYRAIAFEVGRDIMFVHVNEHDKAYRWASGRQLKLDSKTNRIRVIEVIQAEKETSTQPHAKQLFSDITDKRLRALGVSEEELPAARKITTTEDLDSAEDRFDPLSYQVLYALAAGYSDEEVYAMTGISSQTEEIGTNTPTSFNDLIETNESRQTIFIPETKEELQRVFDEGLADWRIFLHPEQRKIAYRNYNGPAMARGGAGTGKTVVAMHHAKFLADQIKKDPSKAGQRVLFTTFTTSLAKDIEANLKTLCPEHLASNSPVIEVLNLDKWVWNFLKRKKFSRDIAYFGETQDKLDEIWDDVFRDHTLPDGLTEAFVKSEWSQIIQAKGVADRRSYFKASRTGRGTPLNRKKRAVLWEIFSDYRARMLSQNLAEPDDAYREATDLLTSGSANLPYAGVIVDEAQDMGEQAFRLIRAIIPEKESGDKNSIFIVGDAHQRIYARKASMSACGIQVRGRSRQLRLNYRTTQEIRNWAVAILEGINVDDLDDGIDTLKGYTSLFHGKMPTLNHYLSETEEIDALISWIQNQEAENFQLEDIGVLCRENKQVKKICSALESKRINSVQLTANTTDDRSKTGVRVTTMHRAKGLEFSSVAIPFLSKSAYPPSWSLKNAVDQADRLDIINQHRSLLHVAATRARNVLRVSWSGEVTPLIPIKT